MKSVFISRGDSTDEAKKQNLESTKLYEYIWLYTGINYQLDALIIIYS